MASGGELIQWGAIMVRSAFIWSHLKWFIKWSWWHREVLGRKPKPQTFLLSHPPIPMQRWERKASCWRCASVAFPTHFSLCVKTAVYSIVKTTACHPKNSKAVLMSNTSTESSSDTESREYFTTLSHIQGSVCAFHVPLEVNAASDHENPHQQSGEAATIWRVQSWCNAICARLFVFKQALSITALQPWSLWSAFSLS